MSLAIWSATDRQNRVLMLRVIPGGRLSLSGIWVPRMSQMPSARNSLMHFSAVSPAALPSLPNKNSSWISSANTTSGCSPEPGRAASSGVTLFSGALPMAA